LPLLVEVAARWVTNFSGKFRIEASWLSSALGR